nr:hypothetical protein Iba_chr04cCG9990 [Ipomoea batatas]
MGSEPCNRLKKSSASEAARGTADGILLRLLKDGGGVSLGSSEASPLLLHLLPDVMTVAICISLPSAALLEAPIDSREAILASIQFQENTRDFHIPDNTWNTSDLAAFPFSLKTSSKCAVTLSTIVRSSVSLACALTAALNSLTRLFCSSNHRAYSTLKVKAPASTAD